eukprot:TRINITY_DN5444_c0_g1_i1.p1 TRINITY_DN5444_c0_g1~~TRINITY_DN5444_c0_g1_i1.p1  ORF type:complete len:106 (-),score=41.62 TRINITY_DN5444_c0_g1_i1:71-346(-)
MSKKVVLYGSSATGFLATKKQIEACRNLLQAKKIPFEDVDCAVETERQQQMAKLSGKRTLPQVHVDDKLFYGWDELELLNEDSAEFNKIFK